MPRRACVRPDRLSVTSSSISLVSHQTGSGRFTVLMTDDSGLARQHQARQCSPNKLYVLLCQTLHSEGKKGEGEREDKVLFLHSLCLRWPWWRWQRPALARRRRQNRRRCSLWSSRWCWRRLQRMLLVFGETMTNVHVTKQKRSRSSAHFEDSGETVPACSVAEAAPIRAALPSAGAG